MQAASLAFLSEDPRTAFPNLLGMQKMYGKPPGPDRTTDQLVHSNYKSKSARVGMVLDTGKIDSGIP